MSKRQNPTGLIARASPDRGSATSATRSNVDWSRPGKIECGWHLCRLLRIADPRSGFCFQGTRFKWPQRQAEEIPQRPAIVIRDGRGKFACMKMAEMKQPVKEGFQKAYDNIQDTVTDKAKEVAQTTDEWVRDNPWQVIAM